MPIRRFGASVAHDRIWVILAWLGVALQMATPAFVLWSRTWGRAWVTGLVLVSSLSFLLIEEQVPKLVSFFVVSAAILNPVSWAWEWYQAVVRFDEFVRTFNSFTIVTVLGAAA